MKLKRQKLILRIISENTVTTQEELLNLLQEEGIETTQATVSRDIRELGLRKKTDEWGVHRYVVAAGRMKQDASQGSESYKQILASGIIDISPAGNLIVIKTHSGVAMAVGAAIDNMKIDGVVGCIAGDDTVFVAVSDVESVDKIISYVISGG